MRPQLLQIEVYGYLRQMILEAAGAQRLLGTLNGEDLAAGVACG